VRVSLRSAGSRARVSAARGWRGRDERQGALRAPWGWRRDDVVAPARTGSCPGLDPAVDPRFRAKLPRCGGGRSGGPVHGAVRTARPNGCCGAPSRHSPDDPERAARRVDPLGGAYLRRGGAPHGSWRDHALAGLTAPRHFRVTDRANFRAPALARTPPNGRVVETVIGVVVRVLVKVLFLPRSREAMPGRRPSRPPGGWRTRGGSTGTCPRRTGTDPHRGEPPARRPRGWARTRSTSPRHGRQLTVRFPRDRGGISYKSRVPLAGRALPGWKCLAVARWRRCSLVPWGRL